MDTRPALQPGLYLVATPIGAARDITLRALDVLGAADVLAAEDTRSLRRLMEIHGIARDGRPLVPYHDHNGPAQRPGLLAAVRDGKSVAYVSDAGTPLVADPGYALASAMIDAGLEVWSAPGASALLAALGVAGLPTDRFMFAGFPSPKAKARRDQFATLAAIPATLVFYETARRMPEVLADMVGAFGADRPAALCRELTKRFEQTIRGPLGEMGARIGEGAEMPLKGEFVVVLGPPGAVEVDPQALDAALVEALDTMRVKDAAAAIAARFGVPRKEAYARALALKDGS